MSLMPPPRYAGQLTALAQGLFSGEIDRDQIPETCHEVTIEVFAHGIALSTSRVLRGHGGGMLPFAFPLSGFPRVALPVDLRARIVETDMALECKISLASLEALWSHAMPFRAGIDELRHDAVILRIEGTPPEPPSFQLLDWGQPICEPQNPTTLLPGLAAQICAIGLPRQLMDGREHQLSLVHVQSGLPLSSKPISFRLDISQNGASQIAELTERVARLEEQLRQRASIDFRTVIAPLYRHIDVMTLNQRANFEREIATLRQLLDVEAPARPQQQTAALSRDLMLEFSEEIEGYGISSLYVTTTGKSVRHINSECGMLLPGLATEGRLKLHLQGLLRRSDAALEGAVLSFNGTALPTRLYLNPNSESWNVSTEVPAGMARRDRNLLELQLPGALRLGAALSGPPAAVLHLKIDEIQPLMPAKSPSAAAQPSLASPPPAVEHRSGGESAPPGAAASPALDA